MTLEALSEEFLPRVIWYLVLITFLLSEDIFPRQLTGPGPNGEEITLPVCKQQGRETVTFPTNPTSTEAVSPDLDKCVNFLSVRGWDRFVDWYARIFGLFTLQDERARRRDKVFCGTVGGLQYCFPPCEKGFEGLVKRPLGEKSCFVYNHGKPSDPDQTYAQMLIFFFPYMLFESTVFTTKYDPELHQICGRPRNIIFSSSSNIPRPLLCLPICGTYLFNPSTAVRLPFSIIVDKS